MIPLKLQLKNFVSYGSNIQTINFEPYSFIALCGRNGHGKSALLEALTWAIWGQARKLGSEAKADQGLLKLGQTNMMVCLDFACNNNQYRIKREYTKSGYKSHANLEFAILDPGTAVFRSLSDKTIRITQTKIEKIIGISFESFINSAFLRQGHSNEFSKKSPKERKEILANILGIDHFEQIRKLASDKIKDAVNQKEQLKQINQQIEQEIKQFNTIEQKLIEIEQLLTDTEQKNILLNAQIKNIREQKEELLKTKETFQKLNFEKEQINQTINKQIIEIIEQSKKWREVLKEQRKFKIDCKSNVSEEEQYSKLTDQLKQIRESAQELIKIKENLISKKEELQNYLQKTKDKHTQKLNSIKWAIEEKKLVLKDLSEKLLGFNNNYDISIKLLSELKIECKDLLECDQEKLLEKRKVYFYKFNNQITWLSEEIINLTDKSSIIKNSQNPACPLCYQNLPYDLKTSLKENFEKQISLYNHQLKRLKLVKNKLEFHVKEQEDIIKKIKKIEELTTNINLLKQESDNYQNTLMSTKEILKLYDQNLLDLESKFEKELESDTQYQILLNEFTKYQSMLNAISYDPNQENEIVNKIELINQKKQIENKLIKEILLQEQRQIHVCQLIKNTKELKIRKKIIEKELEQWSIFKIQEKELNSKEVEISQNFENLKTQKENLLFQKGASEQQKYYLQQKKQEYKEIEEKVKILDQTIQEYKAISLALSKDGIQALLIENAIPEIEQEANELLARLTDNQAHIIFESLRDLKSGGSKETLDIKISDPAGIRSYELFSGGEAFKIDFALRIAISKLLAKKSGVALETLIIDEGFGSQDEEGLVNIMQAIYKIKQDFAKIIIVSHLPAIKEQVPVNFIIDKRPEGSIVKVIELG